jgi:hypothetical protein
VKIRVYQGESRKAESNELLGQFEFGGFKKAARGDVRIDVTFEINADGIVNVTACDPETDQQASTQITLSSGLSEDEIKAIIEAGRSERMANGEEATTAGATSAAASSPPGTAPNERDALALAKDDPPELDPDGLTTLGGEPDPMELTGSSMISENQVDESRSVALDIDGDSEEILPLDDLEVDEEPR